jgi:hypothetical protein
MTFTAISVIQPWPWLILRPDVVDQAARAELRRLQLIKDCENRDWETPVRGWVLLHASSRRLARWDYQTAEMFAAKRGVRAVPLRDNLPYGAIVGAIRIDDCQPRVKSPWFVGPTGIIIGESVPFTRPIDCPGALRFFRVPPDGAGIGGYELAQRISAAVSAARLANAFGLESVPMPAEREENLDLA